MKAVEKIPDIRRVLARNWEHGGAGQQLLQT